jgi:hypothetical protein
MPLVRMPNGQYINFDDGTPPEVVEQYRRQHTKTASVRSAPKPISADEKEIRSRVDTKRRTQHTGDAAKEAITHGMFLNFDDNIVSGVEAGTRGLWNALKKRDIGEVGREYRISQEADRRHRQQLSDNSPISSTAGSIVGAVVNPIGAETGVAKLANMIAPAFTKGVQASKLGTSIAKIGNSSVGLGARAGANQSALMAIGDGADLGEAADSGLMGGLFGGALSGVMRGGGKIRQLIKDHKPEAGSRVAYDRIATMLQRAKDDTGAAFTPKSIAQAVKKDTGTGAAPIVADYSPEMQASLAYLARRPMSEAANEAAMATGARADDAAARYGSKVDSMFGGKVDAHGAAKSVSAARKAKGADDYSPEVMDKPFGPSTPTLDTLVQHPTPTLRRAMGNAADNVRGWRGADGKPLDPTAHGWDLDGQGELVLTRIPSFRTFDALKRSYDTMIGGAIKSGDRTTAKMLSEELTQIKTELTKVNPQYGQTLAAQRDAFQRENALQLGETFLRDMKKPRELLDKLKGKADEYVPDIQYGIADALIQMRNTSSRNPVSILRTMMRSPDQRKVMEFVFGGSKRLNEFDKFLRHELRSGTTDKMANAAKNSMTHTLKMQESALDGGVGEDIGRRSLTGLAFGGPLGLASGAWRGFQANKHMLSQSAQDELTRILMGRGDDIAKGVDASTKYAAARKAKSKRAAQVAGKVAGAIVSPQVGDR